MIRFPAKNRDLGAHAFFENRRKIAIWELMPFLKMDDFRRKIAIWRKPKQRMREKNCSAQRLEPGGSRFRERRDTTRPLRQLRIPPINMYQRIFQRIAGRKNFVKPQSGEFFSARSVCAGAKHLTLSDSLNHCRK